MANFLLIAIGGLTGLFSRYYINESLSDFTLFGVKFGTISVNLIGSFIIGIVWYLVEIKVIDEELRKAITIGFLGCFTTFSSYTLETLQYLNNSEYSKAAINILLSNFAGILLVCAGYFLVKFILKSF